MNTVDTFALSPETIRHIGAAIDNHSDIVRSAMRDFVSYVDADGPGVRARRLARLHEALTIQAAGIEIGAHDGSTRAARIEASAAALRAWQR